MKKDYKDLRYKQLAKKLTVVHRKKLITGIAILSSVAAVGTAGAIYHAVNRKGGDIVQPVVDKYLVTFDTDGGSFVQSQLVEKNKTLQPVSDPTKDQYGFEGWYKDDGTLFTFDTPITSNLTLKARWGVETTYIIKNIDEFNESVSNIVYKNRNYNYTYQKANSSIDTYISICQDVAHIRKKDSTNPSNYNDIYQYYDLMKDYYLHAEYSNKFNGKELYAKNSQNCGTLTPIGDDISDEIINRFISIPYNVAIVVNSVGFDECFQLNSDKTSYYTTDTYRLAASLMGVKANFQELEFKFKKVDDNIFISYIGKLKSTTDKTLSEINRYSNFGEIQKNSIVPEINDIKNFKTINIQDSTANSYKAIAEMNNKENGACFVIDFTNSNIKSSDKLSIYMNQTWNNNLLDFNNITYLGTYFIYLDGETISLDEGDFSIEDNGTVINLSSSLIEKIIASKDKKLFFDINTENVIPDDLKVTPKYEMNLLINNDVRFSLDATDSTSTPIDNFSQEYSVNKGTQFTISPKFYKSTSGLTYTVDWEVDGGEEYIQYQKVGDSLSVTTLNNVNYNNPVKITCKVTCDNKTVTEDIFVTVGTPIIADGVDDYVLFDCVLTGNYLVIDDIGKTADISLKLKEGTFDKNNVKDIKWNVVSAGGFKPAVTDVLDITYNEPTCTNITVKGLKYCTSERYNLNCEILDYFGNKYIVQNPNNNNEYLDFKVGNNVFVLSDFAETEKHVNVGETFSLSTTITGNAKKYCGILWDCSDYESIEIFDISNSFDEATNITTTSCKARLIKKEQVNISVRLSTPYGSGGAASIDIIPNE